MIAEQFVGLKFQVFGAIGVDQWILIRINEVRSDFYFHQKEALALGKE